MHKKPVWLLVAVLAVCLALPAAALDAAPDSVSAAPSAAAVESEVVENVVPDTEVVAPSAAPDIVAGSVAAPPAAPSDSAPDTADSTAADLQAASVLSPDSTVSDVPVDSVAPAAVYDFVPWSYALNGTAVSGSAANKVYNENGYVDNSARVATLPIYLAAGSYTVSCSAGITWTVYSVSAADTSDGSGSLYATPWWSNPSPIVVSTGGYYIFNFKLTSGADIAVDAVSLSLTDPSATSPSVPDSTASPTIWDKPFEAYTPAEGYLFLLFVLAVLAVFYKLFKGGVFYV